jgi:ketosteroid isomerase-like protein
MGEEANLELVRRAYDAWNRNDWEELGEIYDPDVVAITPEGFLESAEFRGWPALKERYRDLKEAWKGEQIEVEEIVAEGDQVVARVRWFGVGLSSDAPISLQVTNLVECQGGRIARLEYYWDFQEALKEMRARAVNEGTPAGEAG